ncbi:MAG: hypothetical protein LBB11_03255 [Puniceicoccales bacterium]|jgi:peptidyl-prolyl cis-trans isomerase D|nr:hypothetical protein [Puniceicoccales bacterium]
MISSLQKILQKHHKWLFSILLIIITISFVFTVGSSPGIGRNSRRQSQKFFGHDLSSQKEIVPILQELELSAQLRQIFIGIPQLKDYALLARLTALKLADDLHIPEPHKSLMNRFIENYPAFKGKDRQFDVNKYNNFLEQLQGNTQQWAIFEQMVANDFRIDTVEKLLSAQGYCLAQNAKLAITRALTKYSFIVAKFGAPLLSEEVKVTEEELQKYFKDHEEAYKIKEQILLDYVIFSPELFAEKIPEASPSALQHFYNKHSRQFKHLKKDSEAFNDELAKAYRDHKITQHAMKAADRWVYQLYEKNIACDSEEFKRLLEDHQLKIQHLDAVTLGQFSENQYFYAESLAQTTKLNDQRYYSDPVISKNGEVCILLYRGIIPSLYPPLDSVRAQVTEDFLIWKKEEIFLDQMDKIKKTLDEVQDMNRESFMKIVTDYHGTTAVFHEEDLNNAKITSEEREALSELHPNHPKSISSIIPMKKMEAEIIFLEKKTIPSDEEIDPIAVEKKVSDLEKEDKRNFSDYIIYKILDEMKIKGDQQASLQQYQMLASIMNMQTRVDE